MSFGALQDLYFDVTDYLFRRDFAVTAGRRTTVVLAFVVLMGSGFGWIHIRENPGLREIRQVSALSDMPTTGPSPVFTPGSKTGRQSNSSVIAQPTTRGAHGTYLVAGVDSRAGANTGTDTGGVADVEGSRSDTIALVHVPESGSPTVLSLPRDSSVYRPKCAEWDEGSSTYGAPVPAEDGVKLNSAYATGGPRCLVAAVQQLTGVKVEKFVGIDFAGLTNIVDTLGGVTVDVPYPIVDDELGVVVDTAGMTTMQGNQALRYARARKVPQENRSDYGRITRQQQLVAAMLARVSQIGSDPSKLTKVANALHRNIFGDNVSITDSLDSLSALGTGRYETAPTTGTDDRGNEVIDRDALAAMLQAVWGTEGS